MVANRAKSELLTGFVLSVVLHGTLLVGMMRAEVPGTLMSQLLPDLPEPAWEPPPVPLGLDESMAQTETWLGFEEFKEQSATQAEVEQGAFTTNPGPAAPDEQPGALLAEAAALETAAPPGAQPQPATAPETAETATRPVELQEEVEAWIAALPPDPGPVQAPPADEATQAPATETPAEAQPAPTDPAPEAPTTQPAPGSAPTTVVLDPAPVPQPASPGGGDPGQPADQESDPSVMQVTMEQLTVGKPLAAQGLQMKPRKPVFTALMSMTSAPGNFTAELRFRRDGVPVRVRPLATTGDSRIDEAVINSLYKWRASGKKLDELKEGQTFPVRIKIMLR